MSASAQFAGDGCVLATIRRQRGAVTEVAVIKGGSVWCGAKKQHSLQ